MRKVTFFALVSALLPTLGMQAQMPTHPQYIKYWGDGEFFSRMYSNWSVGTPFSTERADDEEFFISRVRPRTRFVDENTQVDRTLTAERKILWWVPIGVSKWNAMPAYYFNSEVFSTWSYIDHWGNWTAPYLRLPAAFADAAHKNGVSVSATNTIPFGASISGQSRSNYENDRALGAVTDGGAEKYIKYLRYYGIDGAGFNSEFRFTNRFHTTYYNFIGQAYQEAKRKNFDNYAHVWYSLTTGDGSMSGGWDDLSTQDTPVFGDGTNPKTNFFFTNYNWYTTQLNTSVRTATSLNRSTYDVYMGCNAQKGSLSGADWQTFSGYKVSIGFWGAHNANMFYENRGSAGNDPLEQQKAYQKATELFFTGGYNNPIKHHPIGGSKLIPSNVDAGRDFFGMSKLFVAKSTLHGDLARDPFVTYFNLGNGQFFNIDGERRFEGEWYNLGMQDYMPTWRWWFSKNFMGRDENELPEQSLKAEFTWDDAWFGGSCLKISGSTTEPQYLQLFKTQYSLQNGDKVTFRYKVLSGSADIRLAALAQGESREYSSKLVDSKKIQQENWQESIVTVGSGRTNLALNDKTLALLGLKFENVTGDFQVLIGELSIVRNEAEKPQMPSIVKSSSLGNSYRGHDFKLIYKMAEVKSNGEPTYNDEVGTWYYKIYAQQEGEEVSFCTATTSWAAYVVGAPLNNSGNRKVRFGVSAVSLDGKSESDIAWTDYINLTEAEISTDIAANRTIVNPEQSFTIKFLDVNQAAAKKWELLKDGEVKASTDNATELSSSLQDLGTYDLRITLADNKVINKPSYINVIPVEAGTSPEIYTLTANTSSDPISIHLDESATMAYTARPSNGKVSRALSLANSSFKIADIYNTLGIRLGNGKTNNAAGGITISFWFSPKAVVFGDGEDGMRILDISKPKERWPMSEWGYWWINYGSGHSERGASRPSYQGFSWADFNKGYDNSGAREKFVDAAEYPLQPGVWYHIAVTIEYNLTQTLYINGKQIANKSYSRAAKAGTFSTGFDLNISRYAKFGYTMDGYIDEVRVYDRPLVAESIPATMVHLDDPSAVNGLKAYFDFEDEPVGNELKSRVGDVKAVVKTLDWQGEGQQNWKENVPAFGPSTAQVKGNSFPIETTPVWKVSKAGKSEASNDASSGSVKLQWRELGEHPVTLELSNSWGKDSKTYKVVKVEAKPNAIDEVSVIDVTAYPNPFVEELRLAFAESGVYDVALYDLSGVRLYSSQVTAVGGGLHTLNLNVSSGVYILHISKHGKLISKLKVQKK